mgnify:CR=1 FL=1
MGVVAGIGITQFSLSTIYSRLAIDVKGTIVSRQVLNYPDHPQSYHTVYIIMKSDGTTFQYDAQPNDPSLSREIPTTSTLIKEKWHLGYLVAGRTINDFPIVFYLIVTIVGLVILALALFFAIRGIKRSTIRMENS